MWKFAVVPHEGTWIEIAVPARQLSARSRRSPRGNVDWNPWNVCMYQSLYVVPHEGTWIEIICTVARSSSLPSFPTRERGLKFHQPNKLWMILCRSPRGNVDWNKKQLLSRSEDRSRSPRGNVDWNKIQGGCLLVKIVVSHEGTWIEISTMV